MDIMFFTIVGIVLFLYILYAWYKSLKNNITIFTNDKDNHNNNTDSWIVDIDAEHVYKQDIELPDRFVDPITKNATNINKVVSLKRYELDDEFKLLLFAGMYHDKTITLLDKPILTDGEIKIFNMKDIDDKTYLDILNVTTNFEFVKMATVFGIEKNNGEDDWLIFKDEKYGKLFEGVLLNKYLIPTLNDVVIYASELYLDGSLADRLNSIRT